MTTCRRVRGGGACRPGGGTDPGPPARSAVGIEALLVIHGAIIGSIPPPELAKSLALMIPAMNVDDRTELLGGMRASAPAEVFDGVWGLAGSVLDPCELAAVAARLGLS